MRLKEPQTHEVRLLCLQGIITSSIQFTMQQLLVKIQITLQEHSEDKFLITNNMVVTFTRSVYSKDNW